MTMINNNIPMPQVQRQREDIENSSLSPMAAPQGTAFRGKEDDDDKNKTLKTVAFVTLAALGIGYLANSASKGKWNPFDGDWWKSAKDAASNTNTQETKNATNAIVEATSSTTPSLATDLDQKKVMKMASTVQSAMDEIAKDHEHLKGASILEFKDRDVTLGTKTVEISGSKKYAAKVKVSNKDGNPIATYYFNNKGEQVAQSEFKKNTTTGLWQKIKIDGDGNQWVNNGAGKSLADTAANVEDMKIKNTVPGETVVIKGMKAKTAGQKRVLDALASDIKEGAAITNDDAGKATAIAYAFENTDTKTMKVLREQNGWSEAQTKNILDTFKKKFAITDDGKQIAEGAALEFLNKHSGKHVTITQKAHPGESLVQAFRADNNKVLSHMVHYDSNGALFTRYGFEGSKALTDKLKDSDLTDPTQLFSMDGLQITGVADPEHGFISSKETFKVVKTSPDSTEKLFTTVGEGEAKRVTGLGSGDLVFIHGEQSALIDSTKVKLKDAAGNPVTLKDGVHTVVTDINLPDNASWAKIDDKSTIDSLKEDGKLANVTVKKLFKKSGASGSPLELSSQTSEIKSEITKLMQADAQAERESLRLHTMMEGNHFEDGKKDALANSFGQMMGITSGDGKLEVAATQSVPTANTDNDFTKSASHGGINTKYLKDVTGWAEIANSAEENQYKKISEISSNLFTPTASIINTYDGDSLAKMVKRDKGGIVESEEKYTSNGKTKQSIKRREDGSYDVKGYTSDGKLEKQQIAADGEGKIVTKQWKIEKGAAVKTDTVAPIESKRKGAKVGATGGEFDNENPTSKSQIEIKNHGSSANSGDEMVVLTGQQFQGAGAKIGSSTFSALDGVYRDAGVVKETVGPKVYYRKLAYDEKHDCLQMTRALTSKEDALAHGFDYQLFEARKTLTSDISADQHKWRVLREGGGDASALLNMNIATGKPGEVFHKYASGTESTEKVGRDAIKAGFGAHLPEEYIPNNSIPDVNDVKGIKSGRKIATYIWNSIHSDVASAALFGGFAKRM